MTIADLRANQAHEAHAGTNWWRSVLLKNWFPAAALAWLLIALIVLSVINWASHLGLVLLVIVLGVLPGLIALLMWWAWRSSGRL